VIIRPAEDILILNKIRFQEEIRSPEEIKVTHTESKPGELKMAIQLINQLSTEFDIGKYKDTYSSKLLKVIHDKAKGKKIAAPALRVVHSRGRDLMEQLKASLDSSSKRKAS
jgi:DNA end-binding protein Ku